MNRVSIKGYLNVLFLVVIFLLGAQLQSSGFIDEFMGYKEDIVYLVFQHMKLVAVSGGLAILIAIPLGILLSRPRFSAIAETAMQGLNIGTTIPTLVVMALAMTLLGIGMAPAIFGLTIASLLPITRNTYIGLREVPAYIKEAASGMGMTPNQMLFKIEIPNASFVIFAGIRIALAVNVGTAPLAFLIGGGGLGELIFTGIDMDINTMMLAGAIPTSLLAILTDVILAITAFLLVPKGVNPLRK